jgi:hypothetical protein
MSCIISLRGFSLEALVRESMLLVIIDFATTDTDTLVRLETRE